VLGLAYIWVKGDISWIKTIRESQPERFDRVESKSDSDQTIPAN
jgi:hypothetical protein